MAEPADSFRRPDSDAGWEKIQLMGGIDTNGNKVGVPLAVCLKVILNASVLTNHHHPAISASLNPPPFLFSGRKRQGRRQ